MSISLKKPSCDLLKQHYIFHIAFDNSPLPICPSSFNHMHYLTNPFDFMSSQSESIYSIHGYYVPPFSQDLIPKEFEYPEKLLIGHRGSGKNNILYPENTMKSYFAAVKDGADGVEIDLRYSSDHVLFSHHNFSLDPKDVHPKYKNLVDTPIHYCSSDQLKKATVLPTFQQILTELPENIIIDAEIKTNTDYSSISNYVDDCLTNVLKYSPNRKLFFSSFDFDVVISLALKQQHFPTFFITLPLGGDQLVNNNALDFITDVLAATGAAGFVSNALNCLTYPELLSTVFAKGLRYFTWGNQNIYKWSLYEQMFFGVTGFVVDDIKYVYPILKN